MNKHVAHLQDLYRELEQLYAYSYTHKSVDISLAENSLTFEIAQLEEVSKASVVQLFKEGYSPREIGDMLVLQGFKQHQVDSLVSSVRKQFGMVENGLLRSV